MPMPRDIEARRYYRAAQQRLEDGQLILTKLKRPAAAIYLTGYAVECILKALLLSATPVSSRVESLREFRGAAGHDLAGLSEKLGARGVRMPPGTARALNYVTSWSVSLRYEPGPGNPEAAKRFIESARAVMDWAERRL